MQIETKEYPRGSSLALRDWATKIEKMHIELLALSAIRDEKLRELSIAENNANAKKDELIRMISIALQAKQQGGK